MHGLDQAAREVAGTWTKLCPTCKRTVPLYEYTAFVCNPNGWPQWYYFAPNCGLCQRRGHHDDPITTGTMRGYTRGWLNMGGILGHPRPSRVKRQTR